MDITIPTLETETLVLRCPQIEDFESYAAFRGSERARILGGPFSRAQAFDQLAEIIGHWHLRGYGRWMVADRKTGAPLGIVGLYYPEDWPEPEIAWSVFEAPEGKGVAFEAAVASRTYAFETLGWSTAISLIDPSNTRSVALADRMGCVSGETYEHPTAGTMHVYRHLKEAA